MIFTSLRPFSFCTTRQNDGWLMIVVYRSICPLRCRMGTCGRASRERAAPVVFGTAPSAGGPATAKKQPATHRNRFSRSGDRLCIAHQIGSLLISRKGRLYRPYCTTSQGGEQKKISRGRDRALPTLLGNRRVAGPRGRPRIWGNVYRRTTHQLNASRAHAGCAGLNKRRAGPAGIA